MKKVILSIVFVSSFAVALFAEGYKVNLQGQKQTGMGHIGTSLNLDASSIFYNPGSLSMTDKKYSILFGGSATFSHNAFQYQEPSTYKAESENPMGTPFYFYASGKINDKISAGLGVYTPFGNSCSWGDDWKGRYLIQDIKLAAYYFQPTVSYKINDKLGIGAGFIYAKGSVSLNKAIPLTDGSGEGQVSLEGDASGWGYNLGIFYKATDKMNIGVSYQSNVTMKMEGGDAIFDVPASLATNFPRENKFDAELPLVSSLNLGLSYNFSEKLLVGLDVNYLGWGVYDSLNFDFETNTSALADSKNAREYKNTFTFRLGAQYKASEKLALRVGGYYDMTPTNEKYYTPETPGANKIGLSCGLSYQVTEGLAVDASFLYIRGLERKASYDPEGFAGTYNAWAYIPGIGITYNF